MDEAEKFAQKTVEVLNGYTNELNAMTDAITTATESRKPIPNPKDIYKEISDAAKECAETIDHYDEGQPLPEPVRQAVARVLEDISNCASALVLHMAMPPLP